MTEQIEPRPPTHVEVGDTSVAVVRWPDQLVLRDTLVAVGRPCLLAVPYGVAPPATLHASEDWLRWPNDPSELALRATHLAQRIARQPVGPVELDDDGVLRRGERWVAISAAQLPVIRLLLDHFDRVVRLEDIIEVYAAGGGSSQAASVRTVMSRLAERIRPVGLTITTVRRRGFVLGSAGGSDPPLR